MHKALVGSRLRLAIEALGLKQNAVASFLEISPSKLGNWLRGDNYPEWVTLIRFCDRYGVTMDYLLRGQVWAVAGPLGDALSRLEKASQEAHPGRERPEA